MIWVAIAVGGAAGSLARYGAGRALSTGSAFPWATFFVNVTGCFLIGLATIALDGRPVWVRTGLIVGVLGGYTTFSAFGQEGYSLFAGDATATAVAYTAGSVVAGLLAVYAGTLLGRTF